LKERAKTLVELKTSAAYLFVQRPLPMDEKARMILNDEGKAALVGLFPVLKSIVTWNAQSTETALKQHAESTNQKLGKLAQPLRAALTGTTTSPGIFDVLDVLGRHESLERIIDATSGKFGDSLL
jgi:glutamyl-tRNA synthetase